MPIFTGGCQPSSDNEATLISRKVCRQYRESNPWMKAPSNTAVSQTSVMKGLIMTKITMRVYSTGADGTRTFQIRLRWGFEKDFGDDWKTGFRLATGSATRTYFYECDSWKSG